MTRHTKRVGQVQNWNMTNFSEELLFWVKITWLENWVGCKCYYVGCYCYLWQLWIGERRQSRDTESRGWAARASASLFLGLGGHWQTLVNCPQMGSVSLMLIFRRKLATHFHTTLKCLQLQHNIRNFELTSYFYDSVSSESLFQSWKLFVVF